MVWSVRVSVCRVALLYLENWTLLDFHTWHVYTPPKWQERAITNIFSTILETIKKGKKSARSGLYQFPAFNEARVLHHWPT